MTRRDRFIDLAALLLILTGVALYHDGAARLDEISLYTFKHPGPHGVRQLDVADRARYESNFGIGLTVFGCLVGVGSAVRVIRRKTV